MLSNYGTFPSRLRLNASRGVSWFVLKGCKGPVKLFDPFLLSPLSAHGVKPYFHRMYPRREGNVREYLMYPLREQFLHSYTHLSVYLVDSSETSAKGPRQAPPKNFYNCFYILAL